MSNREIMQQALEALELPEGLNNHEERVLGQACAALRAALAEEALQRLTDVQQKIETALAEQCPHGADDGCKECYVAEQEQHPVEWLTGCPECGMDGGCGCPSGTWNPPEQELVIDCPRCGHCCPQPQQQEPVGWIGKDSRAFIKNVGQKNVTGKPLYTAPPQRKPLTDEEIDEAWKTSEGWRGFARAIEAAHGIKGEA